MYSAQTFQNTKDKTDDEIKGMKQDSVKSYLERERNQSGSFSIPSEYRPEVFKVWILLR